MKSLTRRRHGPALALFFQIIVGQLQLSSAMIGSRRSISSRARCFALPPVVDSEYEMTEGKKGASFQNPIPALGDVFADKLYSGGNGQRIKFGVFKEDIDPNEDPVDPSLAARRRAKAAEDLTNIDDDERARRRKVGYAGTTVTLALSAFLPLAGVPLAGRFAGEIFPVFLSLGFLLSAQEGL